MKNTALILLFVTYGWAAPQTSSGKLSLIANTGCPNTFWKEIEQKIHLKITKDEKSVKVCLHFGNAVQIISIF